jgi:hypothetical protein
VPGDKTTALFDWSSAAARPLQGRPGRVTSKTPKLGVPGRSKQATARWLLEVTVHTGSIA